MKKMLLLCAMFALTSLSMQAQLGKIKIDKAKLSKAGSDVVNAATLTDADVAALCDEYIKWMDAHNPVCKSNSDDPAEKGYADRLAKLVEGHENEAGLKLDIKVYYVVEQNAFACANGSIRVLAGLMDIVTDEELMGIIGHEIGHIVGGDTKDAMKNAYMVSAGKNAVSSAGGVVAALTDSQLGELGSALAGAQFSQKQEYAADDYGYNFLKTCGRDTKGMALALRKIEKLAGDQKTSKVNALFSSHPDSGKRAKRLEDLQK